MTRRKEYDRAFAAVSAVIKEWDPYHLISEGAPDDEFDYEIASVVVQVPRIRSINDAALAVSRVFTSSFGGDTFSPADCHDVGRKLYEALQRANLVEP